ncbi:tRNA (N6-threonylcarbamoyladenosine(37)-N6)-methyltransferase TrmO [Marinibactrum halimedae]|uniref:tRNA (N6-threonylcarbamoyladenosine(37)-N6)-methyltransferase TrmO n=1 Tax=Marinibactrum halimedae TaxID=1444977 RepID=A0AA37T8P8_9GAMM|nr:tRNA (N6-threonylcarbamoyladenosine(37)-N6)-methyltransferase TrmO [Marinibactrum halimedae]MCD9458629.1 tRNA (N6-threonylcarbamoyladenosine(37)-N6)-methyltransferase TrmO [Marinibactrum halimedae]GLS26006.1 tRNA (N6-threonylcarbamoyladenosine(37)-N6)-methyltransferase TrmO [Marinibactrum halimedae]
MLNDELPNSVHFTVIGVIRSCFGEKFGVPRQPGLAPSSNAQLELLPPFNQPAAVSGLECVSHVWLQFLFHHSIDVPWRASVRPPRLGGNKKMGVFATRSPVRPNPIGLSVVKLESIDTDNGRVVLNFSGIDLVDGTPILDIKPYVPYVDCLPDANNDIAATPPLHLPVSFERFGKNEEGVNSVELSESDRALIIEVLQQDPRPSFQSLDTERVYGMKLRNHDLRWRYGSVDNEVMIFVEKWIKLN